MSDEKTKQVHITYLRKAIDLIENNNNMREVSNILVGLMGEGFCDLNCMVTNAPFFQNILDLIPTPVYYKDLYGVYVGCNEAMAKLHNMTKSEIVGRTTAEIYTEEEARVFSYSDTVLINEKSHEMIEHKGKFTTMGGAYHILHKKLILNPDGSPAGVLGFINDVSEIKQNEERAWQSEAFYKSLFDFSPRPRIIFNEFNILEDMNNSAIELFGGGADYIGQDIMNIFDHYEDYEKVMDSNGMSVRVNIRCGDSVTEAIASLTVSRLFETERYAVSFVLMDSIK